MSGRYLFDAGIIPMQRAISLDATVVARPDQISAELPDEMVILSLATGKYFGLNPVGAQIWEWIQQPRSVAELRDLVLERYADVDTKRCVQEVIDLLQQMEVASLIEVSRPAVAREPGRSGDESGPAAE
jgi:hypothetical protein